MRVRCKRIGLTTTTPLSAPSSTVLLLLFFAALLGGNGCTGLVQRVEVGARAAAALVRDVRILRDSWGVPHVFGHTDADVAYGLAYAHAEDDFATIELALLAARGQLASVLGRRGAANDYLVALMGVWRDVDTRYETDLSPETRALVEGYAQGLNRYAELHPGEVRPGFLPVRGRDVVAGFVHKTPLFYGLDKTLRALMEGRLSSSGSASGESGARASSGRPGPFGGALAGPLFAEASLGLPVGSNTFAVAPSRSADGHTRLAVNSHQPWKGPVAWYEAHVHSDEGWNMVGGVFPGAPLILHGHNRDLGWAFTVNRPDLVDIYRLEMNPQNRNQYRLDGRWRDLERETARIRVKIFGPLHWTFEREVARSVHGFVLRLEHGTYAIRYAGAGDIRQVEQWYRMNRARNIDEWESAMRLRAIPSFNAGYADGAGHIEVLYNALLPLRAKGTDWRAVVPGDRSDLVWREYLPFDRLPRVRDPASGFVQNCNSSPFATTVGPGNPNPDAYPERLGIERRMTNRALRARELLGADASITSEEFEAYKFDVAYSPDSEVAAQVRQILAAAPFGDAVLDEAASVLRGWNLRADADNAAAAIGVLSTSPLLVARIQGRPIPDLLASFENAARVLHRTYGRIDVPWQRVNRLRRGSLDLGLAGAPDVLHAVYGELEDGHLIGRAGDSYVLLVDFGPGGVHSRSVHQFGSATQDERSVHYADQAPLFAAKRLKSVWMSEREIRAHLEREYRPGEELESTRPR